MKSEARSVQDYIDETPNWKDGTLVPTAPMTSMQWRIWGLATAGKFFEGLVIFLTGVALPLISEDFGIGATGKGLVGAASLLGILIGATALGGLSDRFGRKGLFIFEMALFTLFVLLTALAPNFPVFVLGLFGMGLALGCDYPTAHAVISESIPSRDRGRLVLGAFGFQAVGAFAGALVGWFILKSDPVGDAWRMMYGLAVVPAALVTFGRFFITQSAHWLVGKGRIEEAERTLMRLLNRVPHYPKTVKLHPLVDDGKAKDKTPGMAKLFKKKHRRATILAAVPWFLQDLGTYGIGIFTPTILVKLIGEKSSGRNLAEVIHNDLLASKGAAIIDLLLIVGIVAAIVLADRVGRIRLQMLGFIGCAMGLLLAAISTHLTGAVAVGLVFVGFMLFNFMTNLGPNAMTYLIAGEVFPTKIRGVGAGFAASFAKIGAVLTAFLFPFLLTQIGTSALLYGLVVTSLIGAFVTWKFQIETMGTNLESLSD